MQTLVIVLRLFHVISAMFWFGGLTMIVFFLMPAVGRSGEPGQKFMQYLMGHSKISTFMPVVGVLTVLSGLGLFWRNTSTSAGVFAKSVPGMTYSLGGLAAIIALIIGIIMIGRSANEMARIGAAIGKSGGPPSGEQTQRMVALRARMETGNKIVWSLLLITVICMAIARYL